MAQKVNVGGKLISRPGVYTLINSGIQNAPVGLDFGHVVIVDDGIGAGYGGGTAGTVYTFTNISDFQNFVKGGQLWDLAIPLFKPLQTYNGVSKISLVHAREATPATIAYMFANGTVTFTTKDQGVNANGVEDGDDNLTAGYAATINSAVGANATLVTSTITAHSSGVAQVNAVQAGNVTIGASFHINFAADSNLTDPEVLTVVATTDSVLDLYNAFITAFEANAELPALLNMVISNINGSLVLLITDKTVNVAFTQTSGVTQPAVQAKIVLVHSTYKGIDPLNNVPFDGITADNATPATLSTSPVVTSIADIVAWAQTDPLIVAGFTVAFTVSGSGGVLTSADITNNTGFTLASGALEGYTPSALTAAQLAVKTLGNTFFLATKYGSNAQSANNDALVSLAISGSKYERFVIIGGGALASDYTAVSKAAAVHFNSENAIVVHGDGLQSGANNISTRVSSLWKAANVLGRTCGLDVQTPVTFKQLNIDAEFDPLSDDTLELANADGVLTSYFDDEFGYVCVQLGINTLQNNSNVVNEDGSSYSVQLCRIKAQLNKELAIFLKLKFFSNQTSGPNRNTVSVEDIEASSDTFLSSKQATPSQDNYILSHGNIVVTVIGTVYKVNYEFTPNFEVDIIVATGTMVDSQS